MTTPILVVRETPSGAIDGQSADFGLALAPNPAAGLLLYRNGRLQVQELDYTLQDTMVTFYDYSTPQPGDVLLASYRVLQQSRRTDGDSARERERENNRLVSCF